MKILAKLYVISIPTKKSLRLLLPDYVQLPTRIALSIIFKIMPPTISILNPPSLYPHLDQKKPPITYIDRGLFRKLFRILTTLAAKLIRK